jgi:hypothetical protein
MRKIIAGLLRVCDQPKVISKNSSLRNTISGSFTGSRDRDQEAGMTATT